MPDNLALAYADTGDLIRAIPLHESTLIDRERILGNDHPRTLGSRLNLARVYYSAGNANGAMSQYERALEGCEWVLHDNHPLTVATRAALERTRPA
ncbi:tetratricopeptide repeat protein (plasmid) [Streptomyces sp. NBC_01426]|uniref:tetratricopeptide repeat protein n=1 Tax=Streptomyces sp. NBC_01426 TaxID=2975866 RepID=UPI002E362184|nr:tetratricopeptide repeat protein [Streptomyces sp. NBC_01426]